MAAYITKQRRILRTFLEDHPDESLSAADIAKALADQSISVSAVYRNLSALEQDGAVRRVSKTGSREVFYQYLAAEECRSHLHLSCKKCGKTFHMDAEETEDLVERIAALDKFALDRSETVLYGVCEACQQPDGCPKKEDDKK